MQTKINDECIILKDIHTLNIDVTLDCGQAFRWEKNDDGFWHGVAYGKQLYIKNDGDSLIFKNTTMQDIEQIWKKYFDLDYDYQNAISNFSQCDILTQAADYCKGIHILSQQPWEALCSFIISQNNNIPRIKGIISRLCEQFGDKIGDEAYTFPQAQKLCECTVAQLAPIRSGFRAKYIIDAAQKVASGEINLDELYTMPIEQARQELMKIKGVGPKVAECTLLYGLHRLECYPMDVWMKRVQAEFLPNGLPENINQYAGIAQQYLFHYIRMNYNYLSKK